MTPEVLVAIGLSTPLGAGASPSIAAIRAGMTRFAETEVTGCDGEPVRASRLGELAPALSRTARMIEHARVALADLAGRLAAARASRIGLYLGLPEARSGAPFDARALVDAIQRSAAGKLELVGVRESGRAAFFEALAAALADLRGGRAALALVGAVDSMCDPDTLRQISAAGLLLCEQNRDGRIPGEAAGFVLLARPGVATSGGSFATIVGAALGVEQVPFASPSPTLSEGLTEVFRALRTDPLAGARRVGLVAACQPGESFWGTEFMRACLRNTALMPEPLAVLRAGDSLGDAGAGAAPVMLAAAIARMRRHAAVGSRRALVYGCADGGRVGALVVSTEEG